MYIIVKYSSNKFKNLWIKMLHKIKRNMNNLSINRYKIIYKLHFLLIRVYT